MTEKPTYKELEEKIQALENRFRAVVETARDSIFIKNRFLKYTYVNPAMEKLFQLPARALLGKTDAELFGEVAGKHIVKVDSRVLKGEIIQDEYTKPVGKTPITFQVIKVPIRDAFGEITGLCGIARDITERMQAGAALAESEKRQREIIETSNAGYFFIDRSGRFQTVNDAWLRMHKYERADEIIGKHFSVTQVGGDLPEAQSKVARLLAGQAIVTGEFSRLCKDGAIGYHAFTAKPVKKDQEVIGLEGFLIDITAHRQARKALREAHDQLEHRVKERTIELERHKSRLEEVNTALNVMLEKRDQDKRLLEEKVLFNVRDLIEPMIKNLKKSGLSDNQKARVDTLETFLKDIVSPFTQTLHATFKTLTLSEIKVANLIKEGKTTKEIAVLLDSTPRAIEFHRQNLRKKLGLTNRNANLGSHLLSLLK
jgi:PAS domain S-box-containing protein